MLIVLGSAVLSDPDKRIDYDLSGSYEINRYTLRVIISSPFRFFFFLFFFVLPFKINEQEQALSHVCLPLQEYLSRFKGMILTCNGLGINSCPKW